MSTAVRIFCVCFLAIMGACFFRWRSVSTTANGKKVSPELVAGVMSGYVPFATVNKVGVLEGFDIDVAREIATRLGRTLIIKDMSLAALLVALQQGKVDMILSGLSITKSRAKTMTMIHYQGRETTAFPLLFWKAIPADIKTIDDIQKRAGAGVCVEPGSSQEEFITEQYPALLLKRLNSMSEIVLDLKYGKSLAAMVDPDILPLLQQQTPELVALWIKLPREYCIPGNGIAIAPQNKALARVVREVVLNLKADGVLAALERQWFKGGFNV